MAATRWVAVTALRATRIEREDAMTHDDMIEIEGEEYHVTRRSGADLYGHAASTCDVSGCAGQERRLTLDAGDAVAETCTGLEHRDGTCRCDQYPTCERGHVGADGGHCDCGCTCEQAQTQVVTWNPPEDMTVEAMGRLEAQAQNRWLAEVPGGERVAFERDAEHVGYPAASGYAAEMVACELAKLLDAAFTDRCDICGCGWSIHDYDADGNVLPCDVAPDGSTYSREQLDKLC